MPPQPLTRAYPGGQTVHFQVGADVLQKRPQLAALIMTVINIWSFTDRALAVLVTNFLKSDFETVSAMLEALKGGDGRRAAIVAAAQSTLSAEDFNLFTAVMKVIKQPRKRRNEFAHFIWGEIPEAQDVLLLLDPKYLAQYDAKTKSWIVEFRDSHRVPGGKINTPVFPQIDKSKMFVYRERDFIEEVERASKVYALASMLQDALSPIHPAAAHRRNELLNQPEVQQALESLSPQKPQ